MSDNRCEKCGAIIPLDKEFCPTCDKIEMVNHPDHYKSGSIECIDAMVECFGKQSTQDFCLLNAFKYLWRCKEKENLVQDIKKANWYLNKYIELN